MTRGEAVNWLINIMADIGKAEHSELWHYEQALSEIREILESEPERKKGEWKITNLGAVGAFDSCSECKRVVKHKAPFYNYCPNCGADMRGGK